MRTPSALRARPRLLLLPALLLLQWLLVLRLARDLDAGFGPLVLLQVVVLLAVALAAVYALGSWVGGPAVGSGAAAVWALGPYLAVPLVDPRYREPYEDGFLRVAAGLEPDRLLLAATALAASALLVARALDDGGSVDAAAAGAAAGVAAALVPSAVLFLAAAAVALAAARRPRALLALSAGAVPGLLALAVLSLPDGLPALGTAGIVDAERGLREFFWSVRILEWIAVAGAVAVARRSPPLALLLGGWVAAFVLARTASGAASVGEHTFFPALLPALPAYAALAGSLPLLLPVVGGRLAARGAGVSRPAPTPPAAAPPAGRSAARG